MNETPLVWPEYFSYWGKARPGGAVACHLLPFHSLDVAAVGRIYLQESRVLLNAFAELMGCSESAMLSWTTFMLAVHDLGKFSEAFQAQRVDLLRSLQGRGPSGLLYKERHDSLGAWLWNDELAANGILSELGITNTGRNARGVKAWIEAAAGHHGMPPKVAAMSVVDSYFRRADKAAAHALVLDLAELLLSAEARSIPECTGKAFESHSKVLSWWFAGVAVLADWIGSNQQDFSYRDEATPLAAYWHDIACPCAERALARSGVLPVEPAPGKDIRALFPYIVKPSPLQQWAMDTRIDTGPGIYLLEDVMGAGKTEAAVILAYRLMAQGNAAGFFVGLPTMATANAMYKRIVDVYAELFAGYASLVLAHSFKSLVDEFAQSILPADTPEMDAAQADETATAQCTAWLADSSKRALMAPASVGTIDQVLLAVLHSKHQSLRMLGLFNKVLIVDEVHACDTYMHATLQVLLEMHARTGGPAILLSATLPATMKQELIAAYAKGRHQPAPQLEKLDYPLASCWRDGASSVLEEALASRPEVSRTVQVHYESDLDSVYAYIRQALGAGQCVGWIRNTVADASNTYLHLAPLIGEDRIDLFHARFAMGDRLSTEVQVLERFGSQSTGRSRAGRLVVATQVAEQSLDVDFDVLVTDLAPMDRILQRLGRLQRHIRDAAGNRPQDSGAVDQRSTPCLWVYGPVWTENPQSGWYGRDFGASGAVYSHHGQIWLTARVLQCDSLRMPEDARALIDDVYARDDWPATLEGNASKAAGERYADVSQAQRNVLKFTEGYQRGNEGDWWEEARTPSRLGEKMCEVMLAKYVDGALSRWIEGPWAHSMVKVAASKLAEPELPQEDGLLAKYQALSQTLPAQGKWCALLLLYPDHERGWYGRAWTAPQAGQPARLQTWLYDPRMGLRLQPGIPKA